MGYEPPAKPPMRCWDSVSKAELRYGPYLPGSTHRWCWISCNYKLGSLKLPSAWGELRKENMVNLQVEPDQTKLPSLAGVCWRLCHGVKCPSCSAWCCQYVVLQGFSIPFPCVVVRLPTLWGELGAEPSPSFLVLFLNCIRTCYLWSVPLGTSLHQSTVSLSCL